MAAVKRKIFEFAVIYHPPRRKKDEDEGLATKSQLIVEVQQILAKDDSEAAMLAARAIPDEYADKLEDVEIAIRPF